MPLQPNLYLRGCQGVNNGKISAQKQKPGRKERKNEKHYFWRAYENQEESE